MCWGLKKNFWNFSWVIHKERLDEKKNGQEFSTKFTQISEQSGTQKFSFFPDAF